MTEQPKAEIAFIGLGSNLADPVYQVKTAYQSLCELELSSAMAVSSLYSSAPMGPQVQPDYINAVMKISTRLSPEALLKALQTIENIQGRVRQPGQRWVARTLDLDLLLYGQQKIDLPDLIVPHPGIPDRAFVLYPLLEIAPKLVIPGCGDVQALVAQCPRDGLVKINE